jgi:hypothetical protein
VVENPWILVGNTRNAKTFDRELYLNMYHPKRGEGGSEPHHMKLKGAFTHSLFT